MATDTDVILKVPQLNIEKPFSWLFSQFTDLGGSSGRFSSFFETFMSWWYVFAILAFIISALLLIGIVYAMIRFSELRVQEEAMLKEAEHAYREAHSARDENTKWQRILTHISGDSPNDWRLAVIEADIMLDELLESLGYVGASIGDKLKTVQRDAFHSIEDAWGAHKVRNAIAHQGSDFVLTKRAAQDAIAQYQRVFDEFSFI